MRWYEIIAEGYREAEAEFSQASSPDQAKKTIDQYKQLVNRNQAQGNERNIDWWRKQGWERFQQYVVAKAQQPTATQLKRSKLAGKSINLREDDDWLIVIPLDKDASCFHGKNSDWCTTKRKHNYFTDYFHERRVTLVYCLNKKQGGMWALAIYPDEENTVEIFDQRDNSINEDEFEKQTGLKSKDIVAMARARNPDLQVSDVRLARRDLVMNLEQNIEGMKRGQRKPNIERDLLQVDSEELILDYMRKAGIRDDWDPHWLESIIDKSGAAIKYVKNPSPKLQIAAIKENPSSLQYIIQHIENPSDEIKLAAVKQDGSAIHWIEDPSPELQMIAVKQNIENLGYITNPAPEVQMFAVKQDIDNIDYINSEIDPEVQKYVDDRSG